MQLYCGRKLDKMVSSMSAIPAYNTIIQILIKQQIHGLLRRLADTGEESVVLVSNVHDGSRSVLASDKGENFLQEPLLEHTGVVSNFFKHFTHYLQHNEMMIADNRLSVNDVITGEMQGGQPQYNSPSSKGRQYGQYDYDDHSREFSDIVRVKSECDKSIDQTVSRLVKRILSESKKREAESHKSFDSQAGLSRKRSHQYLTPKSTTLGFHDFKEDAYRSSKKRRISEFFPAIKSPSGSTNDGVSDSKHVSERSEASDQDGNSVDKASECERNTDAIVIIKTEPASDEYEYALKCGLEKDSKQASEGRDNVTEDNRSKQEHSNNVINERSETEETDDKMDTLTKTGTTKVRAEVPKYEESSRADDKSSESESDVLALSSSATVHIEEDDVDLPFVQDYYAQRKAPERTKFSKPYKPRKTTGYDVRHLDKDISDGSLQYTPSYKSGHFNLRVRGYSYIRDKVGKLGTVYWKCRQPGCKGRAIKRNNEVIISKDHNHEPGEH